MIDRSLESAYRKGLNTERKRILKILENNPTLINNYKKLKDAIVATGEGVEE